MGAVVPGLSHAISEVCCAPTSRVTSLEERVSDLEVMQQHAVSLGLCCAGPARTAKAYK